MPSSLITACRQGLFNCAGVSVDTGTIGPLKSLLATCERVCKYPPKEFELFPTLAPPSGGTETDTDTLETLTGRGDMSPSIL